MKRPHCCSEVLCSGRSELRSRRGQAGLSLIEMMVGMAVGLIASLVIMKSFSSSEIYRRNISGSGDALQSAAIAAQRLDMVIQESGAGLARGSKVWGCKLLVSVGGSTILPRAAAFPAPFSGVEKTLRAVPAAILDGGASASDTILVMAADSAAGNRALTFSSTGTTLVVSPTPALGMGLKTTTDSTLYDLFLAVPQDVPNDPGDCRMVQAATTFAPVTPTADASLGASAGLKVATVSSSDIPLNAASYGNVDATIVSKAPAAFHMGLRNGPTFALLGVNSNGELVQYDVLNRMDPQVFGENIFLIKARYGLDDGVGGVDNDNAVDEWVSPSEAGWSMADLMDGKLATQQKIGYIKAIRIAMVIRSSQPVSTDAPISKLLLFQDLPEARRFSRDLTTDEQRYQYQIYEWVIPLRNMKAPPNV
jgi:type IV pilus assembly protein PilW